MSKYDCNKTIDFIHELNRVCKMHKRCDLGCPLKEHSCTTMGGITQESIDALQKWSDEHPEPPKITKEERNFIGMFETVGGKRIFRVGGDLYLSLNGEWYELRQKWFQFIGDGESMTFEELLEQKTEEEE